MFRHCAKAQKREFQLKWINSCLFKFNCSRIKSITPDSFNQSMRKLVSILIRISVASAKKNRENKTISNGWWNFWSTTKIFLKCGLSIENECFYCTSCSFFNSDMHVKTTSLFRFRNLFFWCTCMNKYINCFILLKSCAYF